MSSFFFRGGLHPLLLRSAGNVKRGLAVPCPICREPVGQACKVDEGKPVVHDARESLAFNGKKIWV